MAIYWAGNEDTDFAVTAATGFYAPAGLPYCRSDFTRGALSLYGYATAITNSDLSPLASEVWYGQQHCFYGTPSPSSAIISLKNSSTLALAIQTNPTNPLILDLFIGPQSIRVAGSIPCQPTTLTKIDVHYLSAVSGVAELYINGVLSATYSGDLSGRSISSVTLASGGATITSYVSECILASEDTRRLIVKTTVPTGYWGTASWEGGLGFVNELMADTGYVMSSTAADQEAFFSGGSLASRYIVKHYFISQLCAKDVAGPSRISFGFRQPSPVGTTTYTDTHSFTGTGWAIKRASWPINPVTGQPWLYSDFGTLVSDIAWKSET